MGRQDFSDQIALITGGASGIGAATAGLLRARGARVEIYDIADGNDVCDSKMVDAAIADLPKLDILVCSAGVTGDATPVAALDDAEWARVHRVNLDGVFIANRAAARKMLDNGYGRIVNVASIAGKEGNPNAAAYSSSKAAVIAFTKALGKELVGTGILVNSVAPATISTPLLAQLPPAQIEYMTSRIPLGRLGRPDEVAELIVWLASDAMTFSTGACFDISGGRAVY